MHTLRLVIIMISLVALGVRAETVTRDVPLSQLVTRIYLNGAYELNVTQGEEEYVRLTAPEEMVAEIEARVKGKSLYLGQEINWDDDEWRDDRTPIRFDVQLQQIDSVRVIGSGLAHIGNITSDWLKIIIAGSGRVEAAALQAGELYLETAGSCEFKGDSIMASDFGIEIGGSANVEISRVETEEAEVFVVGNSNITLKDVKAIKLDTEISGGAVLEVQGTVSRQVLEINGDGNYMAGNLVSEYAYLEVRGPGEAEINVRKLLTAELSRGADLVYQGGSELEVDISGRGKYRRADVKPVK